MAQMRLMVPSVHLVVRLFLVHVFADANIVEFLHLTIKPEINNPSGTTTQPLPV